MTTRAPNQATRLFVHTGLGIFLLSSLAMHAQDVPPGFVIPGGLGMHVALDTDVGSTISHPKDPFAVHLLMSVTVKGLEVLPQGTVFSGRVISVLSADPKTHTRAQVQVAFEKVLLRDGRSFPILVPPAEQKQISFDTRPSAAGWVFGAWAVQYQDFRFKKGRKGWLHLGFDLEIPASIVSAGVLPGRASSEKHWQTKLRCLQLLFLVPPPCCVWCILVQNAAHEEESQSRPHKRFSARQGSPASTPDGRGQTHQREPGVGRSHRKRHGGSGAGKEEIL